MKRALAFASIAAIALYCLLLSAVVLSPLNPFGGGKWLSRGCDYMMRVTEIDCLLRGVNPYDVWHGDIVLKPYVPNYGEPCRAVEGKEGFTEQINAYAPWEYVMMMPFALMPRTFSWVLYFVLMLAGLGLLVRLGRSFGMAFSGRGREVAMIVGVAPVLLSGLPIHQNFHAGNLSVPVLVAAALMAVCLNRRRDALAGVCWAFAMLKPQLGLIFAVPLLMGRRFLTCAVAAGVCLGLTCVAALICHASPVTLILQTPAANTFAFMGCGTYPYFMCGWLPGDLGIVAGVLAGAVLCFLLTRWLARAGVGDWFVLLMPAAVMGASWTYAQCYSFAMNWFFFLVLVAALAKWPRSRSLWCIAALSALLMTRLYNLAHTLAGLLPGSIMRPDESWHYHADSLVTTASLAVLVAFCACLAGKMRIERELSDVQG